MRNSNRSTPGGLAANMLGRGRNAIEQTVEVVGLDGRRCRIQGVDDGFAIGHHEVLDQQARHDQQADAEHDEEQPALSRSQQEDRQHGLHGNADPKDGQGLSIKMTIDTIGDMRF